MLRIIYRIGIKVYQIIGTYKKFKNSLEYLVKYCIIKGEVVCKNKIFVKNYHCPVYGTV